MLTLLIVVYNYALNSDQNPFIEVIILCRFQIQYFYKLQYPILQMKYQLPMYTMARNIFSLVIQNFLT